MDEREGLKVLVVDDEVSILETTKVVARRFGWDITITTNPGEAVKLAKKVRPDVILSDYNMPGCTGTQLIAILKQDVETKDIPVVLMSGNPQVPVGEASAFLAKPFAISKLRSVLESTALNATCANA